MNLFTYLPFCSVRLQYSFSKHLILIMNSVSSSPGKILFRRSHVRDVAMKRLRFIDDYCRVRQSADIRQFPLSASRDSRESQPVKGQEVVTRAVISHAQNLGQWRTPKCFYVSDIWNLSVTTLEGFSIREIMWPSSVPVIQTFIWNRCWRKAIMT